MKTDSSIDSGVWLAPLQPCSCSKIDGALRAMMRVAGALKGGLIRGFARASPPVWVVMSAERAAWMTVKLIDGKIRVQAHSQGVQSGMSEIAPELQERVNIQINIEVNIGEAEFRQQKARAREEEATRASSAAAAATTRSGRSWAAGASGSQNYLCVEPHHRRRQDQKLGRRGGRRRRQGQGRAGRPLTAAGREQLQKTGGGDTMRDRQPMSKAMGKASALAKLPGEPPQAIPEGATRPNGNSEIIFDVPNFSQASKTERTFSN